MTLHQARLKAQELGFTETETLFGWVKLSDITNDTERVGNTNSPNWEGFDIEGDRIVETKWHEPANTIEHEMAKDAGLVVIRYAYRLR